MSQLTHNHKARTNNKFQKQSNNRKKCIHFINHKSDIDDAPNLKETLRQPIEIA